MASTGGSDAGLSQNATAAVSVDRLSVILGAVVLTALVSAMLLIAPIVVGALITRYGFSPAEGGLTISAELGAMSLAALPALWWMPRWPWHRVLVVALLVMALGNVACAYVSSFAQLMPLRIVTGLAGGSIMVICLAVISMTTHTERNFGWWTVGQLILGAVGLAILPRVLPALGIRGLYFGLATLLTLGLLTVRALPSRSAAAPGTVDRLPLTRNALLALAGVLVFYVALSGVWTYIERIGTSAGLAAAAIGDDLTIASVFGIAGCLAATVLGAQRGRLQPLLAGYLLLIASIAALLGSPGPLRYALATYGFKFAWTFALPFILASIAAQDQSGRLMALTNLMIGCGLAAGPAFVAMCLGVTPDYGIALLFGIGGGALSLLLQLVSLRPTQAPLTP